MIPKKQQLIDSRKEQESDKLIMFELMARYVESLDPQAQLQLEQLRQSDPVAYEEQIKQMVMQEAPQGGMMSGGMMNGTTDGAMPLVQGA
jgi:hypothetical protein